MYIRVIANHVWGVIVNYAPLSLACNLSNERFARCNHCEKSRVSLATKNRKLSISWNFGCIYLLFLFSCRCGVKRPAFFGATTRKNSRSLYSNSVHAKACVSAVVWEWMLLETMRPMRKKGARSFECQTALLTRDTKIGLCPLDNKEKYLQRMAWDISYEINYKSRDLLKLFWIFMSFESFQVYIKL